MRVLLTHRPGGAYGYISEAWANAFRSKQHQVLRWDGNPDVWLAYQPDLYIGCSGHQQPIPKHHNSKIAIHVNPYGPVDLGSINESAHGIEWTLSKKPDAVFGYGHEEDTLLWSYWTEKHNIPWVPMATAGDICVYSKLDTARDLDIAYVGGFWGYKAINLEPYLSKLQESPLTCDFRGWGDWPSKYQAGNISDDEVCGLYNRAKVVPCISEPHTHKHGIDVPERAFKAALCGALVVHDATFAIRRFIPSALVADTPEKMLKLCTHYCDPANSAERDELAEKQRQEVLQGNTYHHRLTQLIQTAGFDVSLI